MRWFVYVSGVLRLGLMLIAGPALSQTNQTIYSDSLQNGWVDWSWAIVNLSASSPVHSGSKSISVTTSNWSALYLHVASIDVSQVTNLSFSINGGSEGGQQLQVQAILGTTAQAPVQLSPLPTNSWRQINLTMADLGAQDAPNFTGFWIQCESSSSVPTFYVDDVMLQFGPTLPPTTNASVAVLVDAAANRHPISPLIYGVCWAGSAKELADLNSPLHRSGGNANTRYNWQINATSRAADWYFESLPGDSSTPGGDGDAFIQESQAGGAQPMLTIPIIGWVAKLGPGRAGLASYSVAKYGAQSAHDPYWADAGNGELQSSGANITTNDPTDANQIADTNFQAGWVRHLTNQWGAATTGGLKYYLMDNEWSIWQGTHRDVHPVGATMDEVLGDFCNYAAMVKSIDPGALVAGPEEWGWSGYLYSGYDQQYGSIHGWSFLPDRAAHGGQDYVPWLLNQIHQRSQAQGTRLLDIFTLHYYPQGGEALSSDVSLAMQLLRNRSTRSLWDTNYVDQSWINSVVVLIPRMKQWVAANYPGTLIGITEYNWGADDYMNGATAQADVLGIFGREGLDLATRWVEPATNSPAYNAFKMFRNYDGNRSTFGETSVRATVPNPDNLAAFAAVRSSDAQLTLIVINKDPQNVTPITVNLTNSSPSGLAHVWQLTSSNRIVRLADVPFANAVLNATMPAQSISLFVMPSLTPFKLRPGISQSQGMFDLWLDGQSGRTYVLESSADLAHWFPVSTNTLVTNSVELPLLMLGSPQSYFRARLGNP